MAGFTECSDSLFKTDSLFSGLMKQNGGKQQGATAAPATAILLILPNIWSTREFESLCYTLWYQ